jgi:hypothetical protein
MFSTLLGVSCLILAATSAFAQSARARIAQTPVRAEASATSATVAMLNAGDPIDVVEADGSWYLVLVPGTQETPLVGYVQAQQIDIVDADGSVEPHDTTPAAVAPKAQGPKIPPTALELQQRELRAKAAAREQALKSEVDAAQARLDALKSGEAIEQPEANQVPLPGAHSAQQQRQGSWFNAGFGFGMASCSNCEDRSGFSGGLSAGKTINDRVLLGVGTSGLFRAGAEAYAGSIVDARLRFYPVRTSGFFVTGGVGLGSAREFDETRYGVSTVMGLGWDIPVRSNLSLTPFWNGVGVGSWYDYAFAGQLGLGITIH